MAIELTSVTTTNISMFTTTACTITVILEYYLGSPADNFIILYIEIYLIIF